MLSSISKLARNYLFVNAQIDAFQSKALNAVPIILNARKVIIPLARWPPYFLSIANGSECLKPVSYAFHALTLSLGSPSHFLNLEHCLKSHVQFSNLDFIFIALDSISSVSAVDM